MPKPKNINKIISLLKEDLRKVKEINKKDDAISMAERELVDMIYKTTNGLNYLLDRANNTGLQTNINIIDHSTVVYAGSQSTKKRIVVGILKS